jgi:hypothetical protein
MMRKIDDINYDITGAIYDSTNNTLGSIRVFYLLNCTMFKKKNFHIYPEIYNSEKGIRQ